MAATEAGSVTSVVRVRTLTLGWAEESEAAVAARLTLEMSASARWVKLSSASWKVTPRPMPEAAPVMRAVLGTGWFSSVLCRRGGD
jgi:hypothetical protein